MPLFLPLPSPQAMPDRHVARMAGGLEALADRDRDLLGEARQAHAAAIQRVAPSLDQLAPASAAGMTRFRHWSSSIFAPGKASACRADGDQKAASSKRVSTPPASRTVAAWRWPAGRRSPCRNARARRCCRGTPDRPRPPAARAPRARAPELPATAHGAEQVPGRAPRRRAPRRTGRAIGEDPVGGRLERVDRLAGPSPSSAAPRSRAPRRSRSFDGQLARSQPPPSRRILRPTRSLAWMPVVPS